MKKPSKFLAVLLTAVTFASSVSTVSTNALDMPEGNPGSNTGDDLRENPLPENLMTQLIEAAHNPRNSGNLGPLLMVAAQNPGFMRIAMETARQQLMILRMRNEFFIEGLRLAYGTYRRHHYVENFSLGHGRTVHITRCMLEESRDMEIRRLDEGINRLQNAFATGTVPVDVERPGHETLNQLRALALFLGLYIERRTREENRTAPDDNNLTGILSVTDFAQQEINEFDLNRIEVRYMDGRARVIGYNGPEIVFEATIGEHYGR